MNRTTRRAATLLATAVLAGIAVSPAHAAPVDIAASQVDGTASFDADNAAGHDSGPNNGIIRTNDLLTMSPELTLGPAPATGAVLRISLPSGMEASTLPAYCGTGSSVLPAMPVLDGSKITADTWKTLPAQVISCNLGTLPSSSTQRYTFSAKVRTEVPNGTVLAAPKYELVSNQPTATTVGQPVTVSAKVAYDISINGVGTQPDTGYRNVSYGKNADGSSYSIVSFPIAVSALSKKGMGPASPNFTFDIPIRPEDYFAAGYSAAGTDASDNIVLHSIAPTTSGIPNMPAGSGGTYDAVTKSGTIKGEVVGDVLRFTVTGADLTGNHTPTHEAYYKNLLPEPSVGVVATYYLVLRFQTKTVTNFGKSDGNGGFNLDTLPRITNLQMTDLQGNPAPEDPARPWNNSRLNPLVVRNSGSWSTRYRGYNNRPGNTPASVYVRSNQVMMGPLGSTTSGARDGYSLPGNIEVADATTYNSSTPGSGSVAVITSCTGWENTYRALTNADMEGQRPTPDIGNNLLYLHPIKGKAVFVSGLYLDSKATPYPDEWVLRTEYTNAPAGFQMTCGSEVPWYTDINDPALGNDQSKVSQGLFTGVTRARITYLLPTGDRVNNSTAPVNVQLRTNPDAKAGTKLPFWGTATIRFVNSLSEALDGTQYAKQVAQVDSEIARKVGYYRSTFNPAVPSSGQGYGDLLTVMEGSVRTKMETSSSASGPWSDSLVATSKSPVSYRITPVFSAPVEGEGYARPVASEVCIPGQVTITSMSLTPQATSTTGNPPGSELACKPGDRWMRFDHGLVQVNDPITPVVITGEVGNSAVSGSYQATASVASPADTSAITLRRSTTSLTIDVPAGIRISKVARQPFVDVTPVGDLVVKPMTWDVDFINTSTSPVSNLDIIDLLPATGHFVLTGVEVPSGVQVLYTSSPSAKVDPRDPSQATTTWCANLGGPGCPAQVGQATAVRITRAGSFAPGQVLRVSVTGYGSGNAVGTTYTNQVAASADGLANTVGPEPSTVTVTGGTISGRAWYDTNHSGTRQASERAVPGVQLVLEADASGGAPGTTGLLTRTVTTGPDGTWSVAGLPARQWRVRVVPFGATETTPKVGTDTRIDSDFSGGMAMATLGVGQSVTNIDAGFLVPEPKAADASWVAPVFESGI